MTDLQTIPGTIESIANVHSDIRIIRIRPINPIQSWVAGQYMELTIEGFPPRPYSIASAPHTNLPEFHIRRAGIAGVSLSQHIANSLQPGDNVLLRGPMGQAGLVKNDTKPLLLIAGGMGLPPMKAIIDDAMHTNDQRPITLYWGTRTAEELYLLEYFKNLSAQHPHFKFIPVVDTLISEIITEATDDLSSTRIYLAGPPAMIHSTVSALLKKNASLDLIHSDDVPTLNAFRQGIAKDDSQ